jgi:L-histidine Nalpha-methyltransferase
MPGDDAPALAAKPTVASLAVRGLSKGQKTLPAKLFYDEEGCRLFRLITELPEYYLTRTELALLPEVAPRVVQELPRGSVLVEYGAGDEAKAHYLLRERDRAGHHAFDCYVPIDVAAAGLQRMRRRLESAYPHLHVHPLATDFTTAIALPAETAMRERLGFFPGSTIGNLEPPEVTAFMRNARKTLGDGARFLVGFDLRKDPAVLIPAYNDSAGVTAAFNLNLLARLNREAEADFDIDAFVHRAIWNDAESRIEMHLVSRCEQTVRVAGQSVRFTTDEFIHTENSYKYTPAHFTVLAAESGWACAEMCTDRDELFALCLLRPFA